MRRPSRFRINPVFKSHAALHYKPPFYLTAIKAGLTAFAVVAGITALYTIFWFFMASSLRDGIGEWVERQRQDGIEVSYAKLELSGFPFRLRATMEAPGLASPDPAAPWAWKGVRAVALMRPWNPFRTDLDLAGSHRIAFTAGGGNFVFDGTVRVLTASLVPGDEWPQAAELTVADLALKRIGGGGTIALESALIKARRYFFDEDAPPDHKTATFDLDLQSEGLRVPHDLSLPLGPDIARLQVKAQVLGGIAGRPWAESLAAWRDAGGTVEVARLAASYGPLALRANGTLALDDGLQPVGAFTARIQGFFETINTLRGKGLIRSRDAVAAKLVLGILAKKPAGGGPATFSLPLTLQEGKFFAGPVPLAEVPPISWPGTAPAAE